MNASTTIVWYIDSGASNHMTGVRGYFIDLSESGLDLEVVLGDNTSVRVVGWGTIPFKGSLESPWRWGMSSVLKKYQGNVVHVVMPWGGQGHFKSGS